MPRYSAKTKPKLPRQQRPTTTISFVQSIKDSLHKQRGPYNQAPNEPDVQYKTSKRRREPTRLGYFNRNTPIPDVQELYSTIKIARATIGMHKVNLRSALFSLQQLMGAVAEANSTQEIEGYNHDIINSIDYAQSIITMITNNLQVIYNGIFRRITDTYNEYGDNYMIMNQPDQSYWQEYINETQTYMQGIQLTIQDLISGLDIEDI